MAPVVAVPILGCGDVGATASWFVEVLGFELDSMFEPPFDEGPVYAIVHRDELVLHLQIRRREIWAGPREAIESDVYAYVRDADALHDELDLAGAPIVREIQDEEYGFRDFCVETPDGHRLVFGSPRSSDSTTRRKIPQDGP